MTTSNLKKVAYFCMEFGIDERLRIYAGGLGILAGDILKTAEKKNYPLIGIGILWKKGYTRQLIGDNNYPYDTYPDNEEIYNYLEDTGVKVSVKIKENELFCRVWKLTGFNNSTLYLLDADLPENGENRWITERLYSGQDDGRIAQEIVLGIGGVRAIRQLNLDIDIFHFNEGHAVLAGIELIREKMKEGLSFTDAREIVKENVVFTTHTPVKEGNEKHNLQLMKQMGAFNGLNIDQMIQIGGTPFNMTAAGLRLAKIANSVAKLHGNTAREMWDDIDDRTKIISITNGVHHKTWTDERIINAWNNCANLWEIHQILKEELINFVSQKTGKQLAKDRLLLGFARRAAAYKRPDLIFRKPEVIEPYLKENKIQIIFSGKAHPSDNRGKDIISHIVAMSRKFPQSVLFLEDYNIKIGRLLTRGVDVWLNNPRKPLEASGTSGMKAAMNGVLNCSTLDGWWPEACKHGVNGWQFGDGYMGEDQDEHDLNALYRVLLEEVLPCYYEDNKRWNKMMLNSIASTYITFSASTMLQNYYDKLYND